MRGVGAEIAEMLKTSATAFWLFRLFWRGGREREDRPEVGGVGSVGNYGTTFVLVLCQNFGEDYRSSDCHGSGASPLSCENSRRISGRSSP